MQACTFPKHNLKDEIIQERLFTTQSDNISEGVETKIINEISHIK